MVYIDEFKIILLPKARKDMNRIYDYISNILLNEIAADNLFIKVYEELIKIKYSPHVFSEINLCDEIGRRYRRIVIKNYIVLYTIDEEKRTVYISHMFYARRNYLKF